MQIKIITNRKHRADDSQKAMDDVSIFELNLKHLSSYLEMSEKELLAKQHAESLLHIAIAKGKTEKELRKYLSLLLRFELHRIIGDDRLSIEDVKKVVDILLMDTKYKGWIIPRVS